MCAAETRYPVVPEQKVTATNNFDTLRPRAGRTGFIVDERGHLLGGLLVAQTQAKIYRNGCRAKSWGCGASGHLHEGHMCQPTLMAGRHVQWATSQICIQLCYSCLSLHTSPWY